MRFKATTRTKNKTIKDVGAHHLQLFLPTRKEKTFFPRSWFLLRFCSIVLARLLLLSSRDSPSGPTLSRLVSFDRLVSKLSLKLY